MSEEEKELRRNQTNALLDIINHYKLYKIKLVRKDKLTQFKIDRYTKYLNVVDESIKTLSPMMQTIFTKTYIENNHMEILSFYSESQYYRLRKKAYKIFLKNYRRIKRA